MRSPAFPSVATNGQTPLVSEEHQQVADVTLCDLLGITQALGLIGSRQRGGVEREREGVGMRQRGDSQEFHCAELQKKKEEGEKRLCGSGRAAQVQEKT